MAIKFWGREIGISKFKKWSDKDGFGWYGTAWWGNEKTKTLTHRYPAIGIIHWQPYIQWY